MTASTKVLFVGGYGRSGSTLLDRTLGQIDGFCSVGELRHIFREGYLENRLCGCGAPFRDCPFWRQVTREAFGELARFDAWQLLGDKERVDRWWRVPQLALGWGSRARRSDLARYRDALRRLYAAIAAVSGADVVVDSSKDVSHGYVLCGIGGPIEPYVLHLVRDSRAVAHSWRRQKFNPGSGSDMERWGLLRTSAEWTAINALTALHRRIDSRYALLRYRDLAADPRAAVGSVLELLGEGLRPLPFTESGTVVLGDDHTVAGNPVRFQRGELKVRPDEAWRREMPAAGRALVTALTLPALMRYG